MDCNDAKGPFYKNSWAPNPKLIKISIVLTCEVMIQLGHNFAHNMTAKLSCHVQNYDQIGSLQSKLECMDLPQNLKDCLINH